MYSCVTSSGAITRRLGLLPERLRWDIVLNEPKWAKNAAHYRMKAPRTEISSVFVFQKVDLKLPLPAMQREY